MQGPQARVEAQQAAGYPSQHRRASIAPHLLPRASEHGRHRTAQWQPQVSIQNLKILLALSWPRPLLRAPQEAIASVVCLLQRKNTLLAKVSRHLLKALVAAARALPQGILAKI